MLSYQHIYHAGNLADVHKHGVLAWMLSYLTRKGKPLTYIETHAGRALYDLTDEAAIKTGEAAQGIAKVSGFFPSDHPYAQTISQLRDTHGQMVYPGSPLVAASLLRAQDKLHLAELHPREYAALSFAISEYAAKCYNQDGFALAHSLTPPMPRRGLMLIDPSYELKTDYNDIPGHIARITRAWNVGIICLWYPILKVSAHRGMLAALQKAHPVAFRHEVAFAPTRPGHGMIGSGLFIVNPPFGVQDEAERIGACFKGL